MKLSSETIFIANLWHVTLTVVFGTGISIRFFQSIHTERMASSEERKAMTSDLQDENKSAAPIVKDVATTNEPLEQPQSNTGSGPANEAAVQPAKRNAGQQLVEDSDSEEEEEWDMSRMGFRGPIGVPVTGGGSLKRPMQKPRPKPST
ncbi:hypothetical protein EV421DRAFT_1906507 [Armillaria borealis]|uniref:Uncharacterized protein n=1 Tax=Armillaria borealis TaxID=47425 RepID=A0AA39J9E0_9AGAR|nr:hypothetical protein EV421DRAFT_1906507 [Armillaria borealis]